MLANNKIVFQYAKQARMVDGGSDGDGSFWVLNKYPQIGLWQKAEGRGDGVLSISKKKNQCTANLLYVRLNACKSIDKTYCHYFFFQVSLPFPSLWLVVGSIAAFFFRHHICTHLYKSMRCNSMIMQNFHSEFQWIKMFPHRMHWQTIHNYTEWGLRGETTITTYIVTIECLVKRILALHTTTTREKKLKI